MEGHTVSLDLAPDLETLDDASPRIIPLEQAVDPPSYAVAEKPALADEAVSHEPVMAEAALISTENSHQAINIHGYQPPEPSLGQTEHQLTPASALGFQHPEATRAITGVAYGLAWLLELSEFVPQPNDTGPQQFWQLAATTTGGDSTSRHRFGSRLFALTGARLFAGRIEPSWAATP
jgi:hypothetical protein